jgi:hypothetical protein
VICCDDKGRVMFEYNMFNSHHRLDFNVSRFVDFFCDATKVSLFLLFSFFISL